MELFAAPVADGIVAGRPPRSRPAHPVAGCRAPCGGRLEIIADFGDQRLAFIEPGTEAA